MNKDELKNQLIDFRSTLLENQHLVSFMLGGKSMYPSLKNGDKIFVEKCNCEDLKTGDIIVFNSNNKTIVHRIVLIKNNNGNYKITTKGDFNKALDTEITSEQVIGKVNSMERKGKQLKLNSLSMKINKAFFLYAPSIYRNINIPYFLIESAKNKILKTSKNLIENINTTLKGSGKLFSINAIISTLQGILPFAIIVCIKFIIDLLSKNTNNQLELISLLVGTALIFLLNAILSELKTYQSEKLAFSIIKQTYDKLQNKHSLLDLSNYENPDKQDKLHRAVREASFRPIKIINALLLGIKSMSSVVFLLFIFITIRWYLILILLISILPDIYVRLKFSRKLYTLKESQSTEERKMYYYNRILTGFPFAKELKLFGFADFYKNRFSTIQEKLFKEKISIQKSELVQILVAQAFAVFLIFASLASVSFLKINGVISLGTVVLFFFAFQRGYSVLNELFRSITQLIEDNIYLQDYVDFLDTPTKADPILIQKPFTLNKGIEIKNLSFNYESSKRAALKSINLEIPAGKTVAFVGANGSGKSTLIKLLCGFYEPSAGGIFFDGTNSVDISKTDIRKNITAVFQDFALYNISAFENLGLGNIDTEFDLDKAKMAAQQAGIADIIENLPNGYHTILGNQFNGGEELSIGQWQKIAIARAFYRDSDLILMDEPSSALDAESEMQIINSLKKLSASKTAIIISHRLSTVQWADLIYLFHEGEVLESGSHDELLKLGGKYYNLFNSSSNFYN